MNLKITKFDNIIRLEEIFYKEHANLYLILGENKNLLIDTGIGLVDISKEVEKISNKPLIVLNTHAHYDHSGGNKFFPEVCIHESEKSFIMQPDEQNTVSFFLKKDDFVSKEAGSDVENFKVEPVKSVIALKDGQKIKIGDFELTVLHMPGHSPGSICLYESNKKIIFSGDVIYEGKLFYNLPFSDKKQYFESLKRLSKINVKECFPGHNKILNKTEFEKILNGAIRMLK